MKKRYLILLLTLLVLPLSVLAEGKPKVLSVDAEMDGELGDRISFDGTVEAGTQAVVCILYGPNNKEIDRLSIEVDGENHFEGRFLRVPEGHYTLSCANYEGGEFKNLTLTLGNPPALYTVTFNSNGGSEVAPVDVTSGDKVARPDPAPTNGNKILVGWFTDNNTFQNEFDFNTPITGSLELFAKWEEPQTFTVSFDTRCEEHIDDAIVEDGQLVARPNPDPENGDKIFGGWFEDDTFAKEYDFNTPVTSSFTLVALWNDPPVVEQSYNIEDASGNKVEFSNEEGHTYSLSMIDYLSVSKEDVMAAAGISSDEYDQIFDTIKDAVKDKGTLLSILDITITDENDHDVTDKEIIVKIKLTEEMKKFNTLQLIYIKDDYTLEDPITLKVEGEYAVGKLNHLSTYTVVGSNTTSNPHTNDNIHIWYGLFIVSIIGLSLGVYSATKLKVVKIKK